MKARTQSTKAVVASSSMRSIQSMNSIKESDEEISLVNIDDDRGQESLNEVSDNQSIACDPPDCNLPFIEQVIGILAQLNQVRTSFISILEMEQVARLAETFYPVSVEQGQLWCREGEESTTMGLVIQGKLAMDEFGGPSSALNPGNIIGDMEMCQASNTSSSRISSVVALQDSVLAEVSYEDFTTFVEGLGPKLGRKLSKILADSVLIRVKLNEDRAAEHDRHCLKHIGTVRRNAISGPSRRYQGMLNQTLEEGVGGGKTERSSKEEREEKVAVNILKAVNQRSEYGLLDSYMTTLQRSFDQIRLLSSMEPDLAHKVKENFQVLQLKDGDILMKEGDPVEAFYILHSGDLGCYAQDKWLAPNDDLKSTAAVGSVVNRTPSAQASRPASVHSDEKGSVQPGGPSVNSQNVTSTISETIAQSRLVTAEGAPGLQGQCPVNIQVPDSVSPSHIQWGENRSVVPITRRYRRKKDTTGEKGSRLELQKVISKGKFVGEMALILESKSDFCYCSGGETTFLMIGREKFAKIRLEHEREQFEYRMSLLQNATFANSISPNQLATLVDAAHVKEFTDLQSIASEHTASPADECYVIIRGKGAHIKPHKGGVFENLDFNGNKGDWDKVRVMKEFELGSVLAEYALEEPKADLDLQKVKLNPTIVAMGDCSCLCISRTVFKAIVGPYETIVGKAKPKGNSSPAGRLVVRTRSSNQMHSMVPSSRRGSIASHFSEAGSRPDSVLSQSAEMSAQPVAADTGSRKPDRKKPVTYTPAAGKAANKSGRSMTKSVRLAPRNQNTVKASPVRKTLGGGKVPEPKVAKSVESPKVLSPKLDDPNQPKAPQPHKSDQRAAIHLEGGHDTLESAVSMVLRNVVRNVAAEFDPEGAGKEAVIERVVGQSLRGIVADVAWRFDDGAEQSVIAEFQQSAEALEVVNRTVKTAIQDALQDVTSIFEASSDWSGSSDVGATGQGESGLLGNPQNASTVQGTVSLVLDKVVSRVVTFFAEEEEGLDDERLHKLAEASQVYRLRMEDEDIERRRAHEDLNRKLDNIVNSRLVSIMSGAEDFLNQENLSEDEDSKSSLPRQYTPGGTILRPQSRANLPPMRTPVQTPTGQYRAVPQIRASSRGEYEIYRVESQDSADLSPIRKPNRDATGSEFLDFGDLSDSSFTESDKGSGKLPKIKRTGKSLSKTTDLNTTVRLPGAKGASKGKLTRAWSTEPTEITPGPGEYEMPPKRLKGGRFSSSERGSAVDNLQKIAASIPGPGQYPMENMIKASGGRLKPKHKGRETSIEWELQQKKKIPGPNSYTLNMPDRRTTNFGESGTSSSFDQMTKHAAKTPGPGAYNPESDTIQARIRQLVNKEYATKSRLKIEQMKVARREYSEDMSDTGSRMGFEPSITAIIRKLWGNRPGSPPKVLPDSNELCIELRNASSIRKSYKEVGIQL